MKYYIYVSDSKVNMLYEQIPVKLREKLATELKIDLKLFSTAFLEKPSEKGRLAKLEVVINHLEKHDLVGTIESPKQYFRGSMRMQWGPLHYDPGTVYFAGETRNTIVGLGGSRKHVIGNLGNAKMEEFLPISDLPSLHAVLKAEVDEAFRRKHKDWNDETGLWRVAYVSKTMKGPSQQLEFLAKRLLQGDEPARPFGKPGDNSVTGKLVLFGSPIYVALGE